MESPHANPRPRLQLTEARIRRSWSQQEVANRLGTTHVNVSRWERGLTKPNPYYRRKLCMLFGLTEEELGLFARVELRSAQTSGAGSSGATASGMGSGPQSEGSDSTIAAPVSPPSPVQAAADSNTESTPTLPLSQAVVGNQPAAPMPIVHDVIYDPAIPLEPAIPLVGRADLMETLKRRLRTGGSVALTALNGLPGVGKTALSVTLAHDPELRGHFRDGVLWAGLGPDPNIPGLLSRWGTMLGISASEMAALSSNEAWARAIRSSIGNRALLLVIDDAWTIEDALIFKVGGPRCAHLVTTRFGAIAVQVAGEGATNIHELTNAQSLELLNLLAPNVVANDEPKAQDLVQAVGGLPLALTLMGNYLRKQSYSGQARRIRAALEKLSDAAERLQVSEPRGPSETHPSLPLEQQQISLQTVIAVTDQQLDAEVRKAFYALAVFPPKPNSFSEEAALAVTGCDFETIDLLADTGLMESSGEGRYTLHQTIADYVRFHLKDDAPFERLIAYAIETVEANKKNYELLTNEMSTILAALDVAHIRGKQVELVRLTDAFAPYMLLNSLNQFAEKHLKNAYEAALSLKDHADEVSILLHEGELARKLGNFKQAEYLFQKALPLARQITDASYIARALLYMGETVQKQGNFKQAEEYLQEGLSLARNIEDIELISALLTSLGNVFWRRAEHTQAEEYLQEGLSLARKVNDRERICTILKTLGSSAARRGDYQQSEIFLQEGLELARQIGNREQIGSLLMNLGATNGMQGKYSQAEVFLQEALVLAYQIEHREWICGLLTNLSEAAIAQGNYIQAESYIQEGLIIAREIGHREWISVLLVNLGVAIGKQKQYKQAEIYLQESINLARQLGIPQIIVTALYEYGNLCLSQEKMDEAETCFKEMFTSLPEGGQDLIALAQYGLAQSAAIRGNFDEAQVLGEESASMLKSIKHPAFAEVEIWLKSIIK